MITVKTATDEGKLIIRDNEQIVYGNNNGWAAHELRLDE